MFQINIDVIKNSKLARYCLILMGILAISSGSVGWKICRARHLVTKVCESFPVGASTVEVDHRVRALGLTTRVGTSSEGSVKPGEMTIMISDGFIFARYYCSINYADGIVTKNSVGFVD